MRFPPEFLDEIRARLPVSEVVGKRVALKRAGREWKGLSPFAKEKTPSFFVNDQKGFFHDFSSGEHGDIFGFVIKTEGVSFPEAVERLAAQAGVPMPVQTREAVAQEARRKSLYEVMELAAEFFQVTLAARPGAKARGYLADRALDPATQLKFRLGYAPADRFALKEYLGGKGVPVEDMIEAGLLVTGPDIPVPYDKFRDRVIFPINDLRGRVIAFGGRALEKDVPAKYLNSPETPLFIKRHNLYNGQAARQAAHDGAPIIVVEGYVDVIALVKAGFAGAVAPLGTALTDEQLTLLWKITDEPVLCFDGDKAGRAAAYRAVDVALTHLAPGKSLRFAQMPEGQDPDDLARTGGREAVDEVLAGARGLADLLWSRETESATLDTPERRAALEARLAVVLRGIADETVRRHYRQDFDGRLADLFTARSRPLPARGGGWNGPPRGNARGPFSPGRNAPPPRRLSPRLAASQIVRGFRAAIPAREALLVLAVLHHPWLLDDHAEDFADLDLNNADADALRRAILDAAAHGAEDTPGLAAALAQAGVAPALERLNRAMTHGSDWPVAANAGNDDVARFWTQIVALHRKVRTLNRELKEAEQALGTEPSEPNLAWLLDVKARLSTMEGTEALIEGFGESSGRLARTS